jgi:16S rRNA (guanine966-N2)-methyltransferase
MSRKKTTKPSPPAAHRGNNQLRIIGGQWRGRKLRFPDAEGLRPTPDRVRETLFNWLTGELEGARCLDAFCGSGALGLEALSRGASHVDFVDNNRDVIEQIKDNLAVLRCNQGRAHQAQAVPWLERDHSPFDVVFIDPPYHQDLIAPCIGALEDKRLLKARAWVYLEQARDEALPALPANWQLHREKTAGQVCYRLFYCASE